MELEVGFSVGLLLRISNIGWFFSPFQVGQEDGVFQAHVINF